jgi:hypothetical protein
MEHDVRGFHGDREHRQPPRVAQAPRHADDHPRHRGSNVLPAVPRSPSGRRCIRPAGSRGPCAKLAQQVVQLGPGRRFGAKTPRHQPEASSACPRCQGPPPAAGSPVPGPTAAWVTTGARGRTHPSVLEGLAPSRKTIRYSRRDRAQVSSLAIPSLSPRRSGRRPWYRHGESGGPGPRARAMTCPARTATARPHPPGRGPAAGPPAGAVITGEHRQRRVRGCGRRSRTTAVGSRERNHCVSSRATPPG